MRLTLLTTARGDRKLDPFAACPLSVRSEEEPFLFAWNGYLRVILRNVAPDLGDPVESQEDQSHERNPMTLPYRQERVLRRADHALRRSDPYLASMLSIFAQLTMADGMPAGEQLRSQRTWAWRVLLWPGAAAAFLVAFIAGGGARAGRACGAASRALWRRVSGKPVKSAASAADRTRGRG
jgi:hypothetical protein